MSTKTSKARNAAFQAAALAAKVDDEQPDALSASPSVPVARASLEPGTDAGDVDGRTLRATGRTHPFATRIRMETHKQMKRLAHAEGITIAELLERAIDAYARHKQQELS